MVVYAPNRNPLRNNAKKAGKYQLVNGMISSRPYNNFEVGILINNKMYLPFEGFSKTPCTCAQAFELYKKLGKKPPTYFQNLLFEQAIEKVNKALLMLGMKDFVFPTDGSIWHEGNLQANSREMHRCVVFENPPQQNVRCEQITPELLVVNGALMQMRDFAFRYVPMKLLVYCRGVDVLSAKTSTGTQFLYRDSRRKLHYIGPRQRQIKVLNNELMVINNMLYQVYKGKLFEMAEFSKDSRFAGYDGEMPVVRTERVYSYFKKNADGIFELDHSVVR